MSAVSSHPTRPAGKNLGRRFVSDRRVGRLLQIAVQACRREASRVA